MKCDDTVHNSSYNWLLFVVSCRINCPNDLISKTITEIICGNLSQILTGILVSGCMFALHYLSAYLVINTSKCSRFISVFLPLWGGAVRMGALHRENERTKNWRLNVYMN